MRFVFLTQYFYPERGAAQVRLAAVIRELRRLGHEVEVVTSFPSYPGNQVLPEYRGRFYQRDDWEGVTLHRLWSYVAMGRGLKRLLNYFSFVLTSLWGLKKAQRPDYVFVESPPLFLGISGYIASRFWRVPMIFNVADVWPDSAYAVGAVGDGLTYRLALKLEAWLYRKSRYVNVVTFGVRELMLQDKQVPAEKILFLPNGVDLSLLRPLAPDEKLRTEMGLPHLPIILYTGTQGFTHGAEVILHAADLLRDLDVAFVFVGGGSEQGKLEQLSLELGLTQVKFYPPVAPEQIPALYSLAFAGIASLRDAPLYKTTRLAKIFAVMGCAKPLIYSGPGEGGELAAQAGAGLLTPAEDANALAQAIRHLLVNPAEAQRMGEQGRRYVEQHLQWSHIVENWVTALQASEDQHS